MYLGKYTKTKNYKADCLPNINGASVRFYNPNLIELDGEKTEKELFSLVKKLCNKLGFTIPKDKVFSIFIQDGENPFLAKCQLDK